jgi:hypothetical protein
LPWPQQASHPNLWFLVESHIAPSLLRSQLSR